MKRLISVVCFFCLATLILADTINPVPLRAADSWKEAANLSRMKEIERLTSIIKNDPQNLEAYRSRGISYHSEGWYYSKKKAIPYYKKALTTITGQK